MLEPQYRQTYKIELSLNSIIAIQNMCPSGVNRQWNDYRGFIQSFA